MTQDVYRRTVVQWSPVAIIAVAVVLLSAGAATASAGRPIVPGYERFHAQAADIAGGRLLLSELNCVACHAADPAAGLQPPRGPLLANVGDRLSPNWLKAFLADPQTTKPGTTMPNVLAAVPENEKQTAIDELVQFLKSQTGVAGAKLPQFVSGDRGKVLYHEVGCVACHGADPLRQDRTTPAVRPAGVMPLPELATKYTLASLSDFLRAPLRHRPAGRMPDLALDAQDATDIAGYLVQWGDVKTAGGTATPDKRKPDAAVVDRGRKWFASLGCAQCHATPGAAAEPLNAPALSALRSVDRGCTSPQPAGRSPRYALDDDQRRAIGSALAEQAKPRTAADQLTERIEQFNCLACHQRDGRGGIDRALEAHFTGETDLGNGERFPPTLTGVGAKLNEPWIRRLVAEGGRVRPQMRARMPGFGVAAGETLGRLLVAHDLSAAGVAAAPKPGDREAGRQLIGATGLSCITCHPMRGKPAIGMQSADLTTAAERLRYDWFRRALLEPAAVRPGTLMPAFWPDGKAANPRILDGDTERQIQAIWAYLSADGPLPDGYPPDRGAFELIPDSQTVLLRCFMKGAGNHAIAVGSPGKVHFAFDAQRARPALAWRGKFVDAYSTWFSRAQPPIEPLGVDVMALPASPPLAVLPRDGAAWPADDNAAMTYDGYRLDADGVPTFLYRVGETTVEDRLTPAADGRSLRRTLSLRGVTAGLHFDPGSSKGLTIRGQPDAKAGPQRVIFDARGTAEFTLEYQW